MCTHPLRLGPTAGCLWTTMGPHLMCDKSWGCIDALNYCAHNVPSIQEFWDETGFQVVHDNAPTHSVKCTGEWMDSYYFPRDAFI